MKIKPKCYTRVKIFVTLCGHDSVSVEWVSKRLGLSEKDVQQSFVFMNREGLLSQAVKRKVHPGEWREDQYWLRKK